MRLSNFLTFAFASAETGNQPLAGEAHYFAARSPLALPEWAPTYFYLVFVLRCSPRPLEPACWRSRVPRASTPLTFSTSGLRH